MVERRVTDGRRIAELLASELTGRADGPLGRLAVVDARDVECVPGTGAFAYGVDADGDRLAAVYVHPERIRIEVERGVEDAVAAAAERDLPVRPVASTPPRAVVFVESGAAVKRASDVLASAARGR